MNIIEYEYILSFMSGGLAGSIFTFIINKLINRHTIALNMQIFPCLQNNKMKTQQCLFKFTLLESYKTVEWVELTLSIKNDTDAENWASRIGLNCDLIKKENNKLTYRIEHLRKGDFVNILFTPPEDTVFDDLLTSALVDYNSSAGLILKEDEVGVLSSS